APAGGRGLIAVRRALRQRGAPLAQLAARPCLAADHRTAAACQPLAADAHERPEAAPQRTVTALLVELVVAAGAQRRLLADHDEERWALEVGLDRLDRPHAILHRTIAVREHVVVSDVLEIVG